MKGTKVSPFDDIRWFIVVLVMLVIAGGIYSVDCGLPHIMKCALVMLPFVVLWYMGYRAFKREGYM